MKLFTIANEIEIVLAQEVDHETGEITDETLEKLAALELTRDEKALAVAAYIKGERAEGEAVKAQADALAQRAQRHKRRADKLLEYLDRYLPESTQLRSDVAEVTWRRSTRVEIIDATKIPKKLGNWKPRTWSPDKNLIKAHLKAGGRKVAGAAVTYHVTVGVK